MNVKQTLLACLAIATAVAATSQAQVIGTYRPSVSRYHGTAPAVVAAKPAYTTAQYPGYSQYQAYSQYPTQAAVPQTAYYPQQALGAGATYAASPIVGGPPLPSPPIVNMNYGGSPCGGGCAGGCHGGAAGYGPTAAYYPVQPVSAVQPVTAYSPAVPYQAIGGPTGQPVGRKHYVGRSLWGSPKVYGNFQPVRNVLRFLGP